MLSQRSAPDWFEQLLTLQDVDHVLSTMRFEPPTSARPVGWMVPRSGYCGTPDGDDEVDLDRVYALFGQARHSSSRGGAVVASASRAVLRSRGRLRRSCPGQVYVTPPASRGFAQHYDDHDVFILQVAGAKAWRVVASRRVLPLRDEPYSAAVEERVETAFDTELATGDTLYLPRGWLHEGAAQEQISVHITVGLFPPLWVDLMKQAVAVVAEEHLDLRKSLPLGVATTPGSEPELWDQFERLVRSMATEETLARALRRLRARSMSVELPMLGEHLSAFQPDPPVTLQTMVARRAGAVEIQRDGDEVVLSFRRRNLRMPSHVHPDLTFIAQAASFLVADLPGDLDDEGKLVLVRRLVKEGVLKRGFGSPGAVCRRSPGPVTQGTDGARCRGYAHLVLQRGTGGRHRRSPRKPAGGWGHSGRFRCSGGVRGRRGSVFR